MNLADAIRKASQVSESEHHAVHPVHIFAEPEPTAPPEVHHQFEVAGTAPESSNGDEAAASEVFGDSAAPGPGLIRLELFLPPEQLNRLIRSVVATQQSVMTLREAATHLRIAPPKLEEMAVERRIPSFQVDGKWRFSRARLEEWEAQNHWDKEQVS
jgi:excisionase family DNA binding protein